MPRADEFTLLLLDTALRSVGTLAFAAVLIRLARSGQWRNPLTHLDFAAQGPRLIHLFGVFAAYFVLARILVRLAGIDPDAAQASGSHDWHVLQCVDGGAKLAACGLIVVILLRHRLLSARARSRLRPGGVLGVSVAAALIIMPVSYLQLQMDQIVWRWLEPDAHQPTHAVLEALANSAWGPWGAVQLSIAAVVVAPLAEELFFRGLLLQTLWGYLGHAWLAIAISGGAFGLIHIQQPQDVVPLATMGVILGYVRLRYRSLTACVFTHALFNARTMAFVLLNPDMARTSW